MPTDEYGNQLPLEGDLADQVPKVMSLLKLDLKISELFGLGDAEAEFPPFSIWFTSALETRGFPAPMLRFEAGFDAGLLASNLDAYNVLNSKLYVALVACISRKASELMQLLDQPQLRFKGREAFRALQERYQPRTVAATMAVMEQLISAQMGDRTAAEYHTKMLYLRSRLAALGTQLDDTVLQFLILKGLPDTEGYRTVASGLRNMAKADLPEALRRLQDQYDAEKSRAAAAVTAYPVQPVGGGAAAAAALRRQREGGKFNGRCNWCNIKGHKEYECRSKLANKAPAKNSAAAHRQAQQKRKDAEQDDPRACLVTVRQPVESQLYESDSTAVVATRVSAGSTTMYMYVDSGASHHIIDPLAWGHDIASFTSSWQQKQMKLDTAHASTSGEVTYSEGVADIHLLIGSEKLRLKQAVIVPACGHQLLSAGLLAQHGGAVLIDGADPHIVLPGNPRVVVPLERHQGLYRFAVRGDARRHGATASALAATVSLECWHQRLSHLNAADMRRLGKLPGSGVELPAGDLAPCEICYLGKAHHQPHAPRARQGAPCAGHTWHTDTAEYEVRSINGNLYSRVLVDEYSRYIVIYCRKNKGDMVADMERLRSEELVPAGRKISHLHADCGGEFDNTHMTEHSGSAGYEISFSPPHTQQSNGIAERTWRKVHDKARCNMLHSELPLHLWEYAVQYAVYCLNRSPHSALDYKTPHELYTGKVGNLANLRVFGCYAFVCAENQPGKMSSKAWRGRFVGISRRVKGAYLVYNERTRQVIASMHVTFIEGPLQSPAPTSTAEGNIVASSAGEGNKVAAEQQNAAEQQSAAEQQNTAEQQVAVEPAEAPAQPAEEPELRTRSGAKYSVYTPGATALTADLLTAADPRNYKEAVSGLHSSDWHAACDREYGELEAKGTWELVEASDIKQDAKVLDSTWVFKTKFWEDGTVSRRKARLVVRGDQQRPGIDFDDVFAPTAEAKSLRVIVALAAHEGWELHNGDVDNAFVNSDIDKLTYVRQPQGYVQYGKDGKPQVFRLRKSLYGLHQSPKLWHNKLIEKLLRHDFQQSPVDPCVLINRTSGAIVVIYVDDIFITGSADRAVLAAVIDLIGKDFSVKDLGFPSRFLGVNFTRLSDGSVTLSQHTYIDSILAKHGMQDAHPAHTPAGSTVTIVEESPPLQGAAVRAYQSMVGELGWVAVWTKPEICFTVSQLQQFMQEPRQCHLDAAKRVLRYLKGHPEGVTYKRREGAELQLEGYADASYANCRETRRSHTGYVFLLCGAAVAWSSKRQPCVTLSTAEAEYVALCAASKQVPPLVQLLEFLGYPQKPVRILEDNTAAIRLASDPAASQRTKHIDVRFHFVREQVAQGVVIIESVRTQAQHADVLTKALSVEQHHFHKAALLGSA